MRAITTAANSRRTAALIATVLMLGAASAVPAGGSAIGPGVDQYFPAGRGENPRADRTPGSEASEGGGIGETAAGAAARRAAADGTPKGTGTIPIVGYPATPLVDVLLVLVLTALAARAAMAVRSRMSDRG